MLNKETGKRSACCHRCPTAAGLTSCLCFGVRSSCLCAGSAEQQSSYSLPQCQHSHSRLQGLESTLGKPPVTRFADPAAPKSTSTPEHALTSTLLVAGAAPTARVGSPKHVLILEAQKLTAQCTDSCLKPQELAAPLRLPHHPPAAIGSPGRAPEHLRPVLSELRRIRPLAAEAWGSRGGFNRSVSDACESHPCLEDTRSPGSRQGRGTRSSPWGRDLTGPRVSARGQPGRPVPQRVHPTAPPGSARGAGQCRRPPRPPVSRPRAPRARKEAEAEPWRSVHLLCTFR